MSDVFYCMFSSFSHRSPQAGNKDLSVCLYDMIHTRNNHCQINNQIVSIFWYMYSFWMIFLMNMPTVMLARLVAVNSELTSESYISCENRNMIAHFMLTFEQGLAISVGRVMSQLSHDQLVSSNMWMIRAWNPSLSWWWVTYFIRLWVASLISI